MSVEKKKFTAHEVHNEVCEQIEYAVALLKTGRQLLLESNVGKDFEGKPPRSVLMHGIARALTECDIPVDREKFHRGLISLCIFYLEDEDVTLALKIRDDLYETDEDDRDEQAGSKD